MVARGGIVVCRGQRFPGDSAPLGARRQYALAHSQFDEARQREKPCTLSRLEFGLHCAGRVRAVEMSEHGIFV